MARRKGKGRQQPQQPAPPPKKPFKVAGAFVIGIAVTSVAFLAFDLSKGSTQSKPVAQPSQPTSHYDLLAMSPEELGKVDPALINLLCAKGLPGTEDLDIPAVLAKLDEWAKVVKFHTERHLYRVTDPKHAEHYNHSEARLRAEFIVQVLQEDCGVHYNKDRIFNVDFSNPSDLFIHGMVDNENGGTCASMPVLYTVIGRRLGYPMKLVLAKQHVFCRWDDGKERFNIEGSTNGGINYDPDEHYRTWPKPITDAEMATGEYLQSLTPQEELASFLLSRSLCHHSNNQKPESRACIAEAPSAQTKIKDATRGNACHHRPECPSPEYPNATATSLPRRRPQRPDAGRFAANEVQPEPVQSQCRIA